MVVFFFFFFFFFNENRSECCFPGFIGRTGDDKTLPNSFCLPFQNSNACQSNMTHP